MSGHPCKWDFDALGFVPEFFVLRPFRTPPTSAPNTGYRHAAYHASEHVEGWSAARHRILELLSRPDVQKVAVSERRDARVVLVRYWPGDEIPLGGPDPAPTPPALAILTEHYVGSPQHHRNVFAALKPYLK